MECMDENTTESEASASASNGPKIKDEGEMTKENTLYLISLVKSYGCLWNEKDPDFENEQTKADAWERISEAMGRSEEELKTKWDRMHSCFVTYHAKNLSNIIKNKWFAYNALRFLESNFAQPEPTIEEDSFDLYEATVRGDLSDERSLCLINLVKGYKCLWDKNSPEYRNQANKIVAWDNISLTMALPIDKVKSQWNRLRTMNRQYIGRMQKQWKNGYSSPKLNWFAFDAMRFINQTRDFLPHWENFLKGPNDSYSDETDEEDPPAPALVNVGNVGNNSVAEKSADKPTIEKLTKVAPLINATPQNQSLLMANGSAQNVPPTRTHAPVRVKRLVPARSAQDPLRIERRVVPAQAQGQPAVTVTPQLQKIPQNHLDIPNDNVPNPPPRIQKFFHLNRSIPSSSVHDPLRIVRKVVPVQLGQTVTSATNQSSAKSFVNLVEHELNELSADYAAKAQVEIYRIIGKFKLKDSNRKKARIQLQKNSTAEYRTHYQLPELQLEKPQPVRILAVHRIEAQPDNPIVIIPDLPTEVKTEPAS